MSGDRERFNAKGLVYLGARDFYAERVAASKRWSGGWYDVMPILPVSRGAARAAQVPWSRFIRQNAIWLAERYRVIVSIASAELVVQRLPDLSLRYFDFGDAAGKMVDDRVFEADRYGIPEPLVEWFSIVTAGFVPVALGIAGAKNVRVRTLGNDPDGEAHGVPLVRSRYHITWD